MACVQGELLECEVLYAVHLQDRRELRIVKADVPVHQLDEESVFSVIAGWRRRRGHFHLVMDVAVRLGVPSQSRS